MKTLCNEYERPEMTVLYMEPEGGLMTASGLGVDPYNKELGDWDN